MTGENMGNHQSLLQLIAQNTPPWVGIAIGHFASNPVSDIAVLTTIAFNVIGIWTHFRKTR